MSHKKTDVAELKLKEVAFVSLQIGFVVSLVAVGFVLGGRFFDSQFGTKPIGVLAGIFLGLMVSLWIVWQIVKPLWVSLKK